MNTSKGATGSPLPRSLSRRRPGNQKKRRHRARPREKRLVQDRMTRTLETAEESVCSALLEDAAIMIDGFAPDAPDGQKLVVSCRMVIRALGDGGSSSLPVGATQGQMSALGYQQSWTFNNGSVGELYLAKQDKAILGHYGAVGSRSPVEDLVTEVTPL